MLFSHGGQKYLLSPIGGDGSSRGNRWSGCTVVVCKLNEFEEKDAVLDFQNKQGCSMEDSSRNESCLEF